jgi:hypothetical protein
MTKPISTWLDRSNSYATAIGSVAFSPSRSVAGIMNTAAVPLPHVPLGERDSAYHRDAEAFIQRTLGRAGSTVSAWTRETVEASSAGDYGKSLFVSGEAILKRGADPDAAADYATGRMLIAASQRAYLTSTERNQITEAVKYYRAAARHGVKGRDLNDRAVEYATAHLAGTVATLRGREAVLSEWRGWAGYFAAAESDHATPEQSAAFINGPAPMIVRAAFVLGELMTGRDPEIPADLAPLVALGQKHFESLWKKGEHWNRAAAAIASMLPPESGQDGDDDGDNNEEQEGTEEGGGTGGGEPSPSGGETDPVPGSEAEQMTPDASKEGIHTESRTEPANPNKTGKLHAGMRRYPVRVLPLNEPSAASLDRTRLLAAPMIAALRRIAWDSLTPPTMDRAQMRGELDEGAMARFAAFQDPRVFQTRQEIAPATVAVTIVIDCSGSMGMGGTSEANRIDSAKAVGYALATVFGSSPTHRVSVIGHDVRYGNGGEVCVYDTQGKPNRIASLRSGGDNADGFAIGHAIDQTLRQTADRRAVFLLADGQPSANGYGMAAAVQHIRHEVARGLSRGVDFLAIGIDGAMTDGSGAALFGSRFVSIPNTRAAGPLLARVIGKIGRSPCA